MDALAGLFDPDGTRGEVEQLLARMRRALELSSSFPDDVFDRRGIEEAVRRHWEGRENLTHLVSMLATVATAFRLLLWQTPRAVPADALPPA